MKAYRLDVSGGYVIDSYGEGLYRIKPINGSQGRCLFFARREEGDPQNARFAPRQSTGANGESLT